MPLLNPPAGSITPARASELLQRADAAMMKLNRIKAKTEEKAGEVFKMLETIGGGLAVGAIRGKYGAIEVGPGVPLELIAGAGLHAIGFLDLAGKHSEHVHNLGNSVLTTWAAIEGLKMAGGVVLSAEEVRQLALSRQAQPSAPAMTAGESKPVQAPAPTEPHTEIVEQPTNARRPALRNGQRSVADQDLIGRPARETEKAENT